MGEGGWEGPVRVAGQGVLSPVNPLSKASWGETGWEWSGGGAPAAAVRWVRSVGMSRGVVSRAKSTGVGCVAVWAPLPGP